MKTLADEWKTVIDLISEVREADPAIQKAMERCFFGGGMVVLSNALQIGEQVESDEEGVKALKAMLDEVRRYFGV